MAQYSYIEIPFNFRHTCWFCGEPSDCDFDFPKYPANIRYLEHPPLTLPACDECAQTRLPSDVASIWAVRDHVIDQMMKTYADHLAIGQNWTEQELNEAEFSGAVLGGFGESAWQMYSIAKSRITYQGWPLVVDGLPVEGEGDNYGFEFEGVRYLSLNTCLEHLVQSLRLDKLLLPSLVDILGVDKLEQALKIAKLNKALLPYQREQILDEARQQVDDALDMQKQAEFAGQFDQVEAVYLDDAIATQEAIQWALQQGIYDLASVCQHEDEFFDAFAHLGGPQCFHNYYGLQRYFELRQNPSWAQDNDPNLSYFS